MLRQSGLDMEVKEEVNFALMQYEKKPCQSSCSLFQFVLCSFYVLLDFFLLHNLFFVHLVFFFKSFYVHLCRLVISLSLVCEAF